MLNGLDLFSGIGGLTMALSDWVKPLAYCEIDRYAQAVLLSRMSEGSIATAPIWDDVKSFNRTLLGYEDVDIIYGGFPCQDVSVAGLRKGLDGERTGLFREAIRLVRECRPKFVFLENVPGIRRSVPIVRGELEALGYSCRDGFLSAAEIGANHRRNRWWLLAYSKRVPIREQSGGICGENGQDSSLPRINGEEESLAVSGSERKTERWNEGFSKASQSKRTRNNNGGRTSINISREWWAIEPGVGRVAHGIPARMDRLRGLGNAVVPLQAREAFKRLMGIKE